MKIKSIKLKGFRSHGNTNIQDMAKYNILMGYNGAGKSSIIDAIAYALTGTCRGTDEGGRGAEVLNMQLADAIGGIGYVGLGTSAGTIERTVGQGPRSPIHENILKKSGLSGAMARVLAQPTQFMRLKPAEQKELLVSLMSAKVTVDEVKELLGDCLNVPMGASLVLENFTSAAGLDEVEKQVRAQRPIYKRDLADCVYKQMENMPHVDATPELLEEGQETLSELEREIGAARERVYGAAKRNSELLQRRIDLKARAQAIDDRLDAIGSAAHINEALTDLRTQLQQAEHSTAERSQQANKIRAEIQLAKGNAQVLKENGVRLKSVKGNCPTCTQSVPESHSKETLANMGAKYKELEAGIKKHEKLLNELEQLPMINPNTMRTDIQALEKSLHELDQLKERREETLKDLDKAEAAQPEAEVSEEGIKELEQRIVNGKAYIADIQAVLSEKRRAQATRVRAQELEAKLEWTEAMVALVGPKGPFRAKLISGELGGFLLEVNALVQAFGLPQLTVELEPWTIKVGTLPAVMLSESEQYRLSLAFAGVFAKRTGAGILCLDAAEILDSDNRGLLPEVLDLCGLEQAIIAATGDMPETVPTEGEWKYYQVSKSNGVSVVRAVGQGVAA